MSERPEEQRITNTRNLSNERILVIGSGWHFSSGISHYTYRLALALAKDSHVCALLMRRLVPRAFYPGRNRVGANVGNPTYPSSSIPVYDGVDWYWGRTLTNALRYIDQQRPTVVILQWWTGAVLHTYIRLARYAARRGARVVLEWHESQDVGESAMPGARLYVKSLMPFLLSSVSAHVVHSKFDLCGIQAAYELGDAPISVMPHGPYDHLVNRVRDVPEGESHEPFHLLYFGVVRPFKGVEDLVVAFNALDPEQAAGFHVSIVGETWEGWNVPNQAIADSPYKDRIERVDRYVTDGELSGYISRADAVVLPYHRSSASGPLHLAMSAGLPVIVTAVGGLVEAVRDYSGAILVPPKDPDALKKALLDITTHPLQRHADPHSWDRTVNGYQMLIDDLMPRQATPARWTIRRSSWLQGGCRAR